MTRLIITLPPETVADGVVRWVRRCGSDTNNVRDAAHEASHALEYRVRRWGREAIHSKVIRSRPGDRARTEVEARAVERLVCAAVNVTHDWSHFNLLCAIEATRSGISFPSLDVLETLIQSAMRSTVVVERTALILAMGTEFAPC